MLTYVKTMQNNVNNSAKCITKYMYASIWYFAEISIYYAHYFRVVTKYSVGDIYCSYLVGFLQHSKCTANNTSRK
jgi:hypothetical protein